MSIRITYVKDARVKRVTIAGTTMQDAIRWMLSHEPGIHVFRSSIMRARRHRLPMIAADETGTGAHRPVRR